MMSASRGFQQYLAWRSAKQLHLRRRRAQRREHNMAGRFILEAACALAAHCYHHQCAACAVRFAGVAQRGVGNRFHGLDDGARRGVGHSDRSAGQPRDLSCDQKLQGNVGRGAGLRRLSDHSARRLEFGIRCGRENIITADRDLAEAERRALKREVDLRESYVPNMPPCVRVVTIDPNGNIVVPPVSAVEYSGQAPELR